MTFFQTQAITEKYENAIDKIIAYNNFKQTSKLAIILFSVNLILLFIDYLNNLNGLWIIINGYKFLFYAHVALGSLTLFSIFISYWIIANTANDITLVHKSYVILVVFLMLSLAAVISGWIDQRIHGQITVYVVGCLILAVMYNFKPKVTALLYGLSWLVFIISLSISQKNPILLQAHYVNTSLVVLCSYFLSTALYKYRRQDLLHAYYLEDLVKERTQELQIANDLLTQEILDRKLAEIEMARLDRLNLIGEMAASISHEVRNPMTTVKGFLQLLMNKQEQKDKEFFVLMVEELDRANSILSEFLSISRTKLTLLECHNINDIVTSTLPLVQADVSNNDQLLKIELNIVPNLPLNIQEIRQLLLNLVRNGLEAMSSGGQLSIRTFSTNSDVVLAVSDEGRGIEPYVLEKLGTPFFTTKEQGTGLGLAVCYGIVSRHNGKINVESSPQGSTFYVSFKLSS
ncbi:two-component sensor histidine kinase [Desulfosporosinus fructosivorans]|uniref:histidine kinase n=1 Tax=Desulfosporosinus fructosivorans TaxID=2018669 RepID=A0A4Z0R960_9FIRM|nr:ATP-binding protein [Desulfosporosinus fructosivorans]TGE39662.1 two-component sensor histidine kinase [Desulfosporosinus fructosivorans]